LLGQLSVSAEAPLAVCEDITSDGLPEIIIGAPGWSGNKGQVYLYSGLGSVLAQSFTGGVTDGRYGASICTGGDLNNDGITDIAIGAPRSDPNGVTDAGRVEVRSGADWTVLTSVEGINQSGRLGFSVAILPDINGDGHDDLLVGEPDNDTTAEDAGAVFVYSGIDGTLLRSAFGDGLGDRFGHSVSAVGNIDGDSVPDYAVGAPYDDNVFADSGSVRVFSGATGAFLYFALNGGEAGDNYGWGLSKLGDINADGRDEFLVRAPNSDRVGVNSGMVRVVSGIDGFTLREYLGDAGDELGSSACGVGDYNSDGCIDFGIGAWHTDFPSLFAGRFQVYSGCSGELISNSIYGAGFNSGLGYSCAGGVDFNGDSHDDFAVSSGALDVVYIYSGQPTLGQSYCLATVNTSGSQGTVSATGSSSYVGLGLTLLANGLPGNVPALFFYGPATQSVPFGYGYLCITGPIVRLGPPVQADATGFTSRLVDLDSTSLPGGPILPGDWYFQCWYRDPLAGPPSFNLTDGLRVTVGP
jgi:hypothetical protein